MLQPTDIQELIPGAKHFRWYEALWLPMWSIYCFPSKEQFDNIREVAVTLDRIRALLGDEPLKINSWLRPEMYNKIIGGATHSMHKLGGAVDFTHPHLSCDDVRRLLLPSLDTFKIRMEDKPGSSWVHIDTRQPSGSGRFFRP